MAAGRGRERETEPVAHCFFNLMRDILVEKLQADPITIFPERGPLPMQRIGGQLHRLKRETQRQWEVDLNRLHADKCDTVLTALSSLQIMRDFNYKISRADFSYKIKSVYIIYEKKFIKLNNLFYQIKDFF